MYPTAVHRRPTHSPNWAVSTWLPLRGKTLALATLLPLLPLRRAEGEERVDLKTLYYKEDGNRMQVFAPSASFEKEITPSLTIKIQGVYNAISGATPTGAPPPNSPARTSTTSSYTPASTPVSSPVVTPSPGEHEIENGEDHRLFRVRNSSNLATVPLRSWAKAGATPAPAPAPSSSGTTSGSGGTSSGTTTTATPPNTPASNEQKVPTANSHDQRYGLVLDLIKTFEHHTLGLQFAYSTESDYDSKGLALRDAIDFNQKNTTLLVGASLNHDLANGYYQPTPTSKNAVDGMIGVTQLLDPKTIVTANLTLGRAQGYLTDPYKVVELNGQLVGERRPEERAKQVLYLSLTRAITDMDASLEFSYRFYHDTFGIAANTFEVAWYQKLGSSFILRPMARYYQQGAADFYAVRFSGSPEFYSADYRLSELSALGFGLKLIWKITPRFSVDIDAERYEQQGRDGVTAADAYPGATIIMAGATLWF